MQLLAAVAGGNSLVLMLGLVSGIVGARALGPVSRGQYVATYSVASIASVAFSLGIVQALVTYRGPDRGIGKPLKLQAALSLFGGASALALLVGLGVHPWLTWFGVGGGAAVTTGSLLTSLSAGLAQRRGDMARGYQWVRLVPQSALVLALLVLWAYGTTDPNIWLVATGLALLAPALVQFLRALKPYAGGSWLPSRELARQAFATVPMMLGILLVNRLDALIVSVAYQPEQAAYYAVALAALAACSALGTALGMIAFSQLRQLEEVQAKAALIRATLVKTILTSALTALPILVFAPSLIRTLLGASFLGAVGPTRVLVVASVAYSVDYLLLHALLILGGHRVGTVVQTLVAACMAVLLVLVAPDERLLPVAWIVLAMHTALGCLLYLVVTRQLRVSHSAIAAAVPDHGGSS